MTAPHQAPLLRRMSLAAAAPVSAALLALIFSSIILIIVLTSVEDSKSCDNFMLFSLKEDLLQSKFDGVIIINRLLRLSYF